MGEMASKMAPLAATALGKPALGKEARGAKRHTLLIRAAKLLTDQGEFLCIVRDVSETGMSVRIFHPLPQAGKMTIEMQNGDRYPLELRWQDKERAGFRFAHGPNLVRIIECPSNFSKRPVRINLHAAVKIEASHAIADAIFQDISQQGAKVLCDEHYAIDQSVRLLIKGTLGTRAKVRWRKDGAVGLVFDETFQYEQLARIVQRLQRQR